MKLHAAAANSYFYPDVMVTCSAADLTSPLTKSEPTLLIEVLSPSTAAYDRGEKFAQYRGIPGPHRHGYLRGAAEFLSPTM